MWRDLASLDVRLGDDVETCFSNNLENPSELAALLSPERMHEGTPHLATVPSIRKPKGIDTRLFLDKKKQTLNHPLCFFLLMKYMLKPFVAGTSFCFTPGGNPFLFHTDLFLSFFLN